MAKVGLAAELAKQAAQAAREEVAAQSGEAKTSAAPQGWRVPQLAQDFGLDQAVHMAAQRVAGHYQQALAPQGLDVQMEQPGSGSGDAANLPQEVPPMQAFLREQGTGRLVKAYTTPALLTMFATQQQATGVVVDGQV